MSEKRITGLKTIGEVDLTEKTAPNKFFVLPMTILLITGLYPVNSKHSFITRSFFTTYGWFVFVFLVTLNPISKAIALPNLTNIDDLTDNISFLANHVMAAFKIAIFLIKRKDLLRLVEIIQSQKFRHENCSCPTFSANSIIRGAVQTTKTAYYIFSIFVWSLIFGSSIKAVLDVPDQEIRDLNATQSAEVSKQGYRTLPFHSWYPFSTQKSPNYELAFIYQMTALGVTAQIVMALDTLVVGFMVHIRVDDLRAARATCILFNSYADLIEMQSVSRMVQLEILSHNLRFAISHAKNRSINVSASDADTASQIISNESPNRLIKTIELNLERNIAHHQAIIRLSQDLESVFTHQLLLQFVCSLFAYCTLLWQVSSTPIMSAKFASMLSYLGATAFQLFIYCWFGNEVILESLSVAQAAWDSGWEEISSRRYSHGVAMIIHRSQNMIMITAGRFVSLSLDTFVMISRAAYSCFAVLKKKGN